jgi:YD repeat-containing protein
MNFRLAIFVSIIVCSNLVQAQTSNIQLPVVIPPSPEVTQLSKVGNVSTGLHTGSASVTIPLYSFNVNKLEVNIGLNYSSNGIKLDEIPGRAGLGWNLLAGGVVNRTIHDEPDGDVAFLPPPSDLTVKNQALYSWINGSTSYDTEWDEYSYSFNGISGKFFLDNNGNGYCIPHNNYKVKVNGFSTGSKNVEITSPEGIRYEFGASIKEKTRNINIGGGNGSVSKSAFYETAWFLERIVTPEGGIVNFNYQALEIKTTQGRWQTVIVAPTYTATECTSINCQGSEQSGLNAIEYSTYAIKNINTDGINIDFIYGNRPDASGDMMLTYLMVKESGSVIPVKRYAFKYHVPDYQDGLVNKRFFLEKLSSDNIGTSNGTDISQGKWETHQFSYYDMDNMPNRLTYGQDWWGYNNGKTNSVFAPKSLIWSNGADRTPGTITEMQKGLLQKVTYPTSGTDEFIYEPHTISTYTTTPIWDNRNLNANGTGINGEVTSRSTDFIITGDQYTNLTYRCFNHPAIPYDGNTQPDKIFVLKVKKSATNEVVLERRLYNYGSGEESLYLLNNTSYYLELTVKGEVNAGTAAISFNPTTNTSCVNQIIGGVRVKQINSFDPIAQKTSSKYFKYAAVNTQNRSSGVGILKTENETDYKTGQVCTMGQMTGYTVTCNNTMISSNSISPYFSFNGSPVAYTNVIESDDANFLNGCTEHIFHTYVSSTALLVLLGSSPLGAPTNISSDLNGMENKTRFYKKSTEGLVLLKEIVNNYGYGGITNNKSSTIVRKRYDYQPQASDYSDAMFSGYDVVQYFFNSSWVRLESTVTTEYDQDGGNPLSNTVSYIYGEPTHLQPTKIVTTTSNSLSKSVVNKYPKDFVSSDPTSPNAYDLMVTKNIIIPVVQQINYLETATPTVLSQNKTEYDIFNGGLIAPRFVKSSIRDNSLENRIAFNSYNTKGKVLEQQKVNDVLHSYIWGYQPERSIAEVINGAANEIAYTSFEAGEGKGNWSFNNAIPSSSAITGGLSFNLSTSGTISKPVSSSGSYIISYWTMNTSPLSITGTVSVNEGEQANGWRYFEHKLTGVSTVSINGSGLIDELRLYPVGGFMTSYTYKPLTGIISAADANSRITSYDYDGMGRLTLVRDQNKNILKKYCYNLFGQAEDCGQGSIYTNTSIDEDFLSQNCPTGANAIPYHVFIPQGTFTSEISTTVATDKARAYAQTLANENGMCGWVNIAINSYYNSQVCTNGSQPVPYFVSIPAASYNSMISQADADAKAEQQAQTVANQNGLCIWLSAAIGGAFTPTCPTGMSAAGIYVSLSAGAATSTLSQGDADNKARIKAQTIADQAGVCYYSSIAISGNYTPTNCPAGTTATPKYISISAGAFTSTISQSDANNKAEQAAQNLANQSAICYYSSVAIAGNYTPTNCPAGTTTKPVYITITAGTYTSTISQADADNKAQQAAQNQANLNATCIWSSDALDKYFYKQTCPFQAVPVPFYVSLPAGAYTSTISKTDANNKAEQYGQSQADSYGSCIYESDDQTGNYYKEGCPAGTIPVAYYVSVPAGMFSSYNSKDEANAQARQYGQDQANQNGQCTSNQLYIRLYKADYLDGYVLKLTAEDGTEYQYNVQVFWGFQYHGTIPPGKYRVQIYNTIYGSSINKWFWIGGTFIQGDHVDLYNVEINTNYFDMSIEG